MGRAGGSLAMLALAAFLAGLAWNGPMDNGPSRHDGPFRFIVNTMIDQLGTQGAAAFFTIAGLALTALIWFGHRPASTSEYKRER